MKTHVATVHNGVYFKCSICPHYASKDGAAFHRHMTSVHRIFYDKDAHTTIVPEEKFLAPTQNQDEFKSRLRCMECGGYYDTEEQLNYHYEADHVSIPQPLFCDLCGRSFQWKRDLERHQISHAHEEGRSGVVPVTEASYGVVDAGKAAHIPDMIFSELPPMTNNVQVMTTPITTHYLTHNVSAAMATPITTPMLPSHHAVAPIAPGMAPMSHQPIMPLPPVTTLAPSSLSGGADYSSTPVSSVMVSAHLGADSTAVAAPIVSVTTPKENGEVPASLTTLIADLETLTPLRPLPAADSAAPQLPPFSTPQTLAAPFLNHDAGHGVITTVAASTPRPPSGDGGALVSAAVSYAEVDMNGSHQVVAVNSTSAMLSDILNAPV